MHVLMKIYVFSKQIYIIKISNNLFRNEGGGSFAKNYFGLKDHLNWARLAHEERV